MESSGLRSQLLSVAELLAAAAAAEIHRRVADSCAELRLELIQSRTDIELLKRQCEAMEKELLRGRRRVFCPPPTQRCLSRDRQVDTDTHQPQQCALAELNGAEHMQIKEEMSSAAEESSCFEASPPAWTDSFVDSYPADPESPDSPADNLDPLAELELNMNRNGTELVVKQEKEDAALLSSRLQTEEGDDQLCLTGDPSSSCVAERQLGKSATAVTPHSDLDLGALAPRKDLVEKLPYIKVNVARGKRRSRMLGRPYKRPQEDEGRGALSQNNFTDRSSFPQQWQHQYRDCTPTRRGPVDGLTAASGRTSLVRWMRPSRVREKKYSCTYCDRSFTRFSQLKEHLRSHTGEKPFSCQQCGRSFTKHCNLTRHAVVHSGEKPFECSLCGKCFTQRSSLTSHQKTAH
ncbi:zinc finger protein 135 [Echeneis naucrates]|uniref:zinc finger protein 135 n=1 Tax=Echeneis naucrates TaxID=173247 RepID=UPI0011144494|nr:zinc finger protein 135-like [Echeneis naucrates]